MHTICADCKDPIGQDEGPPDGWQLEDGRTVCHVCCVKDTRRLVDGYLTGTYSYRPHS
jgi:hypothetical protein